MKHTILKPILFLLLAFTVSCVEFRDSPFTDKLETVLRQQNIINSERISNLSLSNDFKIAFVSDTHQNYSDFEDVIHIINQRDDIDFVILGGDMTNSSYAFEFDLLGKALEQLNKPFLTVIGNHDAIGDGKVIFKKMFGPYNFTLEFADTRFIFFNNNTLEFTEEGIDFPWLEDELANSANFNQVFLVNHINLNNPQYFEQDTITDVYDMLKNSNLDMALNGHLHTFVNTTIDNIIVHQTSRVEDAKFSIIKVENSNITIQQCEGEVCEAVNL